MGCDRQLYPWDNKEKVGGGGGGGEEIIQQRLPAVKPFRHSYFL